jgi:uncharacterized membrane protein (TIGR02234 family)
VGAAAGTTQPAGRRLYGPVLLVGLAGALGVTVGGSHAWVSATSQPAGLPTIHASASGADVAPLAAALGVVILAGFGAVVATRGWLRRLLGAGIAVASVVVLIAVLRPSGATDVLTSGLSAKGWSGGTYRTSTEPWRWLVLVCSVVTGLAGAATCRYGAGWAVMGSRYDAPGTAVPTAAESPTRPAEQLSETDVWQAIDRGRDPTQDF